MQLIKGNDLPFGRVLVIANGDCCQLLNVSVYNIFQSSSLLFTSDFHFLNELVWMHDVLGREVLQILEERSVAQASIERIREILLNHCQFHESWDTVDIKIMNVFGKISAERQALMDHEKKYPRDRSSMFYCNIDRWDMCQQFVWRLADNNSTIDISNKKSRELKNLILYVKAKLRLTRNLCHSSKGDLFLLDYNRSTESTLSLYKAPNLNSITEEN